MKDAKFNLGNIGFELTLTTGSKVRIHGQHDSKVVEQLRAKQIGFQEIYKFIDKKVCKYKVKNSF